MKERQDEVVAFAAEQADAEEAATTQFVYVHEVETGDTPATVDVRRGERLMHRIGWRWPSCWRVATSGGKVVGQIIGDCAVVTISDNEPLQNPIEVCAPTLAPWVPDAVGDAAAPDLTEYDFAEETFVRPYPILAHRVLPLTPHATYGGLPFGSPMYTPLFARVRKRGRMLCTEVREDGTFCPIARASVPPGGTGVQSSCPGLDDVLDTVDTLQRKQRSIGKDQQYIPLGQQHARTNDFAEASASTGALSALRGLSGALAMYDPEDMTAVTPEQADRAFGVARGRTAGVYREGSAAAAALLLVASS